MLDQTPDHENLLEVNNIEVIYNHVILVLKGVSLNVPKGGITALLGGNGAGKTTTMNCLTGLIQPTAGSATVFGVDLATQLRENRAEIGVCPQHDVLWGELTVEEHLRLYASFKGLTFENSRSNENSITLV